MCWLTPLNAVTRLKRANSVFRVESIYMAVWVLLTSRSLLSAEPRTSYISPCFWMVGDILYVTTARLIILPFYLFAVVFKVLSCKLRVFLPFVTRECNIANTFCQPAALPDHCCIARRVIGGLLWWVAFRILHIFVTILTSLTRSSTFWLFVHDALSVFIFTPPVLWMKYVINKQNIFFIFSYLWKIRCYACH